MCINVRLSIEYSRHDLVYTSFRTLLTCEALLKSAGDRKRSTYITISGGKGSEVMLELLPCEATTFSCLM